VHLRFTQVDAFTDMPFAGNPAAICVLTQPINDTRMQNIAREMNLSETAFLHRRPDGGYDLRWFTPTIEVDLCGHATLAGTQALLESGQIHTGQRVQFHTKSGVLSAHHDGSWIELDFPATLAEPCEAPAGLTEALGVTATFVGKTRFDYLVEVPDEDTVRGAAPDFGKLRALPVRGVIITSLASTPGVDFVSRFFAPGSGIDEDPVTGSAHCALTPFWSQRLGKTALIAQQLSSRGGTVRVRLDGDRVHLGGQAVTVLRGEILV
jgi:PhzF family phenazine biosynthesis protein